MAKYLIQDIIPPERRQPQHRRNEAEESHEPRSLDHQVRIPHAGEKRPVRIQPTHHHTEVKTESQHAHRPIEATQEDYRANELEESKVIDTGIAHTKYFDEKNISPGEYERSSMVHRLHGPVIRETGTTFLRAWLPWIFGLFGVIALALFVLNFFGGATVTLVPKKETVAMDQKMSAFKNPASSEVSFAIMKVNLEETMEVPATGEKTVTEKASGRIVVYNKQTTTQRLIKNTRFQSPTGKIYRIADSINVPKTTTVKGKEVIGSIEVTVYADEAGPEYNSASTDFTLPGLKGSPTFNKVYARGKGAIEGGASGTIKTVTDADLKSAREQLRVTLETKLRTKARSDLAASQVSFDAGIVIELNEGTLSKAEASSKDKAVVSASGALYLVAFDRDRLTRSIVSQLVKVYKGEKVNILNLEALKLEIPTMTGTELWGLDRLDFKLSGDPVIEWSVDEAELKKVLFGIPKQNFKSTMTQFQTIENATADVYPAWKRSFPTEAEDIRIKIQTAI